MLVVVVVGGHRVESSAFAGKGNLSDFYRPVEIRATSSPTVGMKPLA
jgi:hypothetical protein